MTSRPERDTWTPDMDKLLLALVGDGLSNPAIGAALGKGRGAVGKRLVVLRGRGMSIPERRLFGHKPGAADWTQDKTDTLIRMAAENASSATIAAATGMTRQQVNTKTEALREKGVVVKRKRGPRAGMKYKPRVKVEKPAAPVVVAPVAPVLEVKLSTPTKAHIRFERPLIVPHGASLDADMVVWLDWLDTLPEWAGWDKAHDLVLCEAVFTGRGIDLAASLILETPQRTLARFRALTRPLRGERNTLPVDASERIARVLRVMA